MRTWASTVIAGVALLACRSEAPAPTSVAVGNTPPITRGPAPSASAVADVPTDSRRHGPGQAQGGKTEEDRALGGQLSVSGHLPPEVIQRVVRQSFPKIRACYETGLKTNPKLAGKISVRFVIAREGSVSSATSDTDTTITDGAVVSCVVGQFKALTFPQPEGGIVTVVYPVVFSNEG